MGSKNCAELLKCGKISQEEAEILFIITNNISPVFISSFILCQELKLPSMILLSYLVLYLPPVLLGIMNGFETLTRLGGYIMLFSMFASMLELLPIPDTVKVLLTGMTEITNGIHQLSKLPLPGRLRYVLAMSFTAFGGLSGIAQTSSMVKGTDLSMKRYLLLKLVLTAVSTLLAGLIACLCIL